MMRMPDDGPVAIGSSPAPRPCHAGRGTAYRRPTYTAYGSGAATAYPRISGDELKIEADVGPRHVTMDFIADSGDPNLWR